MPEIKRICIYCSSSTKIDDCFFRDARKLGRLMGAKGIAVINGAGKM